MRSRLTRRELVFAATVAGAAALAPPSFARLIDPATRVGPGRFLDGVASGEPGPNAVTFWSRLTTDRPTSGARLTVAADAGMSQTVATVVVPTSGAVDGSLKVRIDGLDPARHYWYVFESADEASPVGRTKTAPPANSNVPVAIGYSSCQKYSEGFYNAHRDAAAQDLDLIVQLGDYTYEYDEPEPGVAGRAELASVDLTTYRDKYRLYRGDPGLRELHRLHPMVHVWDDHEVADNYTDGDPAPSAQQRAAGYRAAFEWLPRIAFPSERYRVFNSFRWGRNVELLLTDQRQYRGEGTMLGRRQVDWLKSGLAASTARWKLIGSETMFAPLGVLGVINPNTDQWDGYPDERAELIAHIRSRGLDDVVFLSGDIHIYMANRVLDGLTPVATEFVGGSVTSSGVPAEIDGLASVLIQTANPHIRYFSGGQHGWARVDASAAELRVAYRTSDILTDGATSSTVAEFVQPAGANDFERVDGGILGIQRKQTVGQDPVALPALPGSGLAQRRARYAKAVQADLRRRAR